MTGPQREIRRAARREKLLAFLKESGVYAGGVVGVFLSPYVDPYLADEPVDLLLSGREIVAALVGGAVAVAAMKWILDKGGKGQPAKLSAWKRRAVLSLIVGLAINYVWPIILKSVGGVLG